MANGGFTVEDLIWSNESVTLDGLMDCLEHECDSIHDMSTLVMSCFCLAMDWAASKEGGARWKTIKERHQRPDLSQEELAVVLGISAATVSRHLQPVRLAETAEFFRKELMNEDAITIIDSGKLTVDSYGRHNPYVEEELREEFRPGAVVLFRGKKYRVEKGLGRSCQGCDLRKLNCKEFTCDQIMRRDGRNVIFKLVKK